MPVTGTTASGNAAINPSVADLRSATHQIISAVEAWLGPNAVREPEQVDGFLQSCRHILEATSRQGPQSRPPEGWTSTQGAVEWAAAARRLAECVRGPNQAEATSAASTFDDAVEHFTSAVGCWDSIKSQLYDPASERLASSIRHSAGVVLVVDDDAGNREVLARRLVRDGREVMLACDGKQAIRMLNRYDCDLVVLDIMMPEMDGYQVLTEMKKDKKLRHLPVIVITAVDDIETIVSCLELGADDYVCKPFNAVVLRVRINSLLERKWLRDDEERKANELRQALVGLKEERERVTSLLLNILPVMVAEELQAHGSIEPMYFEDVTIVFADIVGFTLSTEQLPADVLVDLLHRYFTGFDEIISQYKLEKLKTIGDSYMFAGGIPARSPSHPVDCVLAALEMVKVVDDLAESGPVNWRIRVGVNTGPVIAGVVGINKFAFDIWGDAVNMSSRMESCGQPGRVNLSAATYARVKDFFSCEKRERIRIKDGREVDTYLVSGVGGTPRNGKVLAPRDAFASRYRTYFRRDVTAFPRFLVNGVGGSAVRKQEALV